MCSFAEDRSAITILWNTESCRRRGLLERLAALTTTPLGVTAGGGRGINKYGSPAKSPRSAVLSTLDGSLHLGAWALLTPSLCSAARHRFDLGIQVSRGSVNITLTHLVIRKKKGQLAGVQEWFCIFFCHMPFQKSNQKGLKPLLCGPSVSFKSSLKKKKKKTLTYLSSGWRHAGSEGSVRAFSRLSPL